MELNSLIFGFEIRQDIAHEQRRFYKKNTSKTSIESDVSIKF
jgi:hypothetical protein